MVCDWRFDRITNYRSGLSGFRRLRRRLGVLPPDPRHSSLWTNSMLPEDKQGDAATTAASPMPLDHDGARVACQQRPILRRDLSRVPQGAMFVKYLGVSNKMNPGMSLGGPTRSGAAHRGRRSNLKLPSWRLLRFARNDMAMLILSGTLSDCSFPCLMLLAQSGKCRGFGGGAPGRWTLCPPEYARTGWASKIKNRNARKEW